jgi:hypothetical protein
MSPYQEQTAQRAPSEQMAQRAQLASRGREAGSHASPVDPDTRNQARNIKNARYQMIGNTKYQKFIPIPNTKYQIVPNNTK